MEDFDVVVIGCGPAGICAGIQSARAGSKVLAVELGSCCGGILSRSRVPHPAFFFAHGKRVVGGIGWELAKECLELANRPLLQSTEHRANRPGQEPSLDPMLFAILAEEKITQAGGKILYGCFPESASFDGNAWQITIAGKMLKKEIRAKIVIDCSGDASFVRLAGGRCIRSEHRAPGTLEFRLSGYRLEEIDPDVLEKAYRNALEEGELQVGDYCFPDRPLMEYLKSGGFNLQHIFDADAADAEMQSRYEIAARQRLLRMIRFLRRQKGLEQCICSDVAETIGIRESYRIAGKHVITAEEYLNGTAFDDAVALSYYFIDVHHEKGITHEFIRPGVWPEIPLRALLPENLPNTVCAGRILSCDDRAYSALRVQCSCMAMGQSAGAAAHLAAETGCALEQLDLDALRAMLKKSGAVLPDRYL